MGGIRYYKDLPRHLQKDLDDAIDRMEVEFIYDEKPLKGEHLDFGICTSCCYFKSAESEFGVEVAVCSRKNMERRLNATHKVLRCNEHDNRYSMDLWRMRSMALMIDPPDPKVGFGLTRIVEKGVDNGD